MPWFYILQCSDGHYYVGSTPVIEGRVWQHNAGLGSKYTAARRPVQLVFSHETATLKEAFDFERQIKRWRREKKEALIRGAYLALIELSKAGKSVSQSDRAAVLRQAQDGSPGRRAGRSVARELDSAQEHNRLRSGT